MSHPGPNEEVECKCSVLSLVTNPYIVKIRLDVNDKIMFIRQTLIFFVAVKTFFFLEIVSIRQFVVFHLVDEPGVYNYEIVYNTFRIVCLSYVHNDSNTTLAMQTVHKHIVLREYQSHCKKIFCRQFVRSY